MSNQSTRTKSATLWGFLASGASIVLLLVVTLMVISGQKSKIFGAAGPETAAWGISLTGEAPSLAIVAFIGVILISRRHESL